MNDNINTPPQGTVSDAEVTFSPFITLLSDAINFCHLAENPSLTIFSRASLARASILNTVFAAECATNILLNQLNLSKQMYSQLERLPAMDKFEAILLLLEPSQKFDRGRKEIQALQELITIRNAQVHVKTKHEKVSGEYIDQFTWKFERNDRSSGILKMPENSEAWNSSHSQQALRALDEFLKVYLLEYAKLTAEETSYLLLSRVNFNGNSILIMPEDCTEAIELAKRRLGLRFDYLEHSSPEVRVSIASKSFVQILKHDENT